MSTEKQMTTQEQKDLVRFELIDNIFAAMGLCSEWVHKDRIEEGLSYVIENQKIIEKTLPTSIVINKGSDMWDIMKNDEAVGANRSLLAFARRLAGYRYFAIVRKSKSTRINRNKVTQDLFYKLLR
tara:strand:+ start:782 stop:1159 length:378 start_codon:yes stop_codon:yes gene_type:complete